MDKKSLLITISNSDTVCFAAFLLPLFQYSQLEDLALFPHETEELSAKLNITTFI